MNYFLSLIALLTIVSCKVEKSTSSKKCTFNGEPIECSKQNSYTNTGSQDSLSLVAKINAAISISYNEIEVLENTNDVAKESRNGSTYECSVGTEAGQTFVYKLNGNTLGLFVGNSIETYTRVSGDDKTLKGSWKNVARDAAGLTTTTLVFTDSKMELNVECKFN